MDKMDIYCSTAKKRDPKVVAPFYQKVQDLRSVTDNPLKKKRKGKKKKENKEEPPECPPIPITPSLGTRALMQYQPEIPICEIIERPKYVNPKAVKPIRVSDEVKYKRIIRMCKRKIVELKEPVTVKKGFAKIASGSAEIKEAKVTPKKATPTPSMLVPPTASQLERDKPLAGVTINETDSFVSDQFDLYNYSSFDVIQKGKSRPIVRHYVDLEKEYKLNEYILHDDKDKSNKNKIRKELTSIKHEMDNIREDKIGQMVDSMRHKKETTIIDKEKEEEKKVEEGKVATEAKRKAQIDEINKSYFPAHPEDKKEKILKITNLEGPGSQVWDSLIHDKKTVPWDSGYMTQEYKDDTITTIDITGIHQWPEDAANKGTKTGDVTTKEIPGIETKTAVETSPVTAKTERKSIAAEGTTNQTKGEASAVTTEEGRKSIPGEGAKETRQSKGGVKKDMVYRECTDIESVYLTAGAGDYEESNIDQRQLRDEQAIETYLTKQFRKKVSQISATTSYNPRDLYICPQVGMTDSEILGQVNMDNKLTQKYGPIEEEPKPRKFVRGTLESHSFTNVCQTYIKNFYFGSKAGTMHKHDPNLKVDGKQGICLPVAAYCYAFMKHPIKWETEDIDEVMVAGTNLYRDSMKNARVQDKRELTYQELDKYCFYGGKKIRFIVDEPEVSGFIFSLDRTIFNLTKALTIFFARESAGIFVSNDVHVAIWKDKHFYLFDGVHRTKDMYINDTGVANIANFYDIDGLVTILLQRSGYGNWPFVIHSMRVIKVYDKFVDYKVDELDFDNERDNYNLLSEEKAVLLGSFHLADLCFKYMRNRQAVSVCCMALIYSRLTPAGAWTRTTIDKIMSLGTKVCEESIKCDDADVLKLENMPAYLSIGPYIIEIYIHRNIYCDSIYKRCRCQLQFAIEEFFKSSTNALLDMEQSMMAIFKQRSKFYLFDPYSRNFEATITRDGAACVSMHTNITSMVKTILANHDVAKEIVFHLHGLKVCKIIKDPTKVKQFPKCLKMNDVTIDAFKGRMTLGSKKAVQKRVAVDFSRLAAKSPFLTAEEESVYQMGLGVESFILEDIPPMPEKITVKQMLELEPPSAAKKEMKIPVNLDDVVDLDSPSLSDTQIPTKPLEDSQDEQELEFMDLCSFDLTMDEVIFEPNFEAEAPEGFQYVSQRQLGDDKKRVRVSLDMMKDKVNLDAIRKSYNNNQMTPAGDSDSILSDYARKIKKLCKGPKYTIDGYSIQELGEGEGEDEKEGEGEGEGEMEDLRDWFYAQARLTQVNTQSLEIAYIGRISEMVNTDLTTFPMDLQVLYPTYVRHRILSKRKPFCATGYPPGSPEILSQQEELSLPTNFVMVPDGSQLVRGTKNLIAFDKAIEYMAPFMCIMGATVARKYSLRTWTKEIVDYVLNCGHELFTNSAVRYDQVTKLDIPRITLGTTDFKVSIQYIFDSYMKQKMVEMALTKILFTQFNMGILVTPSYACTVLYKNFLFYLFDPFGNNEVGFSEGSSNEGVACICRFVSVAELVKRIMHNKKKRELGENVEYCRFVLSSVEIKSIPPAEKKGQKGRKGKKRQAKTAEQGEDEIPTESEMGGEDDAIQEFGDDEEEGEEPPEPKVKIGYQYKKGLWVIEGSSALEGRDDVKMDLKNDHFICLCACLMALTCPVNKWDTRKVNAVFDHGNHIYGHADDTNVSNRRIIKNILIGKNFFDIIVKKLSIDTRVFNLNIKQGIATLFSWKMCCFLIQFSNACYAVDKSDDGCYHLFDPYGPVNFKKKKQKYMGGWVRCKDLETLQKRVARIVRMQNVASYQFYTFEVTSIRKAPKEVILSHKMHCICTTDEKKKKKSEEPEKYGKPFNEDPEWLMVDPIPWSRLVRNAPTGNMRGTPENLWNNWDIEYPRDLYSMVANISQFDPWVPEIRRGKGVVFILVVCLGMLEIYELTEWTPFILNSVVVNGDSYFLECTKDKDKNWEMSVSDIKEVCSIFPYQFTVKVTPESEGSMFVVKNNSFNLYQALRSFFVNDEKRYGIIYGSGMDGCVRKNVAFGRTKHHEYFMFDCDTRDYPMFSATEGKAYILRMTSLNRLTHVLTLTLRGGNFYIFDVTVSDFKPME